jgi:hypothetical protein
MLPTVFFDFSSCPTALAPVLCGRSRTQVAGGAVTGWIPVKTKLSFCCTVRTKYNNVKLYSIVLLFNYCCC